MKINVTARDIAKAKDELPFMTTGFQRETCCPVAQALKRKGIPFKYVCTDSIQTENGEIKLPRKVVSWIAAFDRRLTVKPFSFEMYGVEEGGK